MTNSVFRFILVILCQYVAKLRLDYVDYCCREISDFKVGGCKIAKLFAKHFKVSIYIIKCRILLLFFANISAAVLLVHECSMASSSSQ